MSQPAPCWCNCWGKGG